MTRQHFESLAEACGNLYRRFCEQRPERDARAAFDATVAEVSAACRRFNGGFKPERFARAARKHAGLEQ